MARIVGEILQETVHTCSVWWVQCKKRWQADILTLLLFQKISQSNIYDTIFTGVPCIFDTIKSFYLSK